MLKISQDELAAISAKSARTIRALSEKVASLEGENLQLRTKSHLTAGTRRSPSSRKRWKRRG